ncbi:MAG: hypothetical protein LBH06_09075 [Rikenellaceae bacterium]|nr:hypothetical protein [Rikenellaceae bacterium]
MKALFLSYNQAHTDSVQALLDKLEVRGFTKWPLTQGRGSVNGEPHYGSHAWPSMNTSLFVVTEEDKARKLLDALRKLDGEAPEQGLKAYMWSVEEAL